MASWLLRAQWPHRDESVEHRALRVGRTLTADTASTGMRAPPGTVSRVGNER